MVFNWGLSLTLYVFENYLRSHLLRASWLAEKQPITGRYQQIYRTTTRVRVFKLASLFSHFDINDVTRNLDCCGNRLRVQVARYIRRSVHTRILYAYGDQGNSFFFKPLNLYGPASKTTWNWKNCYQDECHS